MKQQTYLGRSVRRYFWRTYDRKEIDLVEEHGGQLQGYEIKWQAAKRIKASVDWYRAYPDASYKVIHKENYLEFIG